MTIRIYGNRPIKTLAGQDTRPTSARVREALFNIWQGQLDGCRWLDLCAGSGAMGAEALCRGASLVVGIERSGRACSVIRQNWQPLAQSDQSIQVLKGDVVQRLPQLTGQQFDRIYFDPPYASGLYHPVLEAIAHCDLLDQAGELAVEHSPSYELHSEIVSPNLASGVSAILTCCRRKTYGSTALTFYRSRESIHSFV